MRPPAGAAAPCRGVHRARVWRPAREPMRQGTGVASLTRKRARHEPGAIVGSLAVSGQSCGPWPLDRGPSDVGGVRPARGAFAVRRGRGRTRPGRRADLPMAPAPAEESKGRALLQGPSHTSNPPPTKDTYQPFSLKGGPPGAARSGHRPTYRRRRRQGGFRPVRAKGPRPSTRIDSFRLGLSLFFYIKTRTNVRF